MAGLRAPKKGSLVADKAPQIMDYGQPEN